MKTKKVFTTAICINKRLFVIFISLWICTIITGIALELPWYSSLISLVILALGSVAIAQFIKKNTDENNANSNGTHVTLNVTDAKKALFFAAGVSATLLLTLALIIWFS